MTQIDDNRGQQFTTAQEPPRWSPPGYQGPPSGPWQQPMQHQQFIAAPPAPYLGAQGHWQWQPTAPGPMFIQQPAVARPTNGTAIFAFVMSLMWIFGIGSILGLIFGIVAARECNRTGEPGNGLATAAAILGFLGLLFSPALFSSF